MPPGQGQSNKGTVEEKKDDSYIGPLKREEKAKKGGGQTQNGLACARGRKKGGV